MSVLPSQREVPVVTHDAAEVVPRNGRLETGRVEHPLLRTLVVGAGVAGRALARDLVGAPAFGLVPIGFLDDAKHVGLGDLRVLGHLDDLGEVVERHDVAVVVMAIPELDPDRFSELAAAAARAGAGVRYLPTFISALERDVVGSDMRQLDVPGLIGRNEVHVVSRGARATVEGKRVLVTGAGGSIGSELCRQVFGFRPSQLFLLDHDESNLHRLQLELFGEALLDDEGLIVADVRDRARIEQIFEDLRPDVVFHAAAHKHLPLLEKNPCEAVKSNVRGTETVLRAAITHGAERFILISTDKAADPTSVLGASKRLAELLVRAHSSSSTAVASVRFGNVLGSRGSLLTVLAEQMRQGVPVTITHPDVTRFFMTIEEAVGLVLEAGRLAADGEIFVLDMGEPVKIVDLVEAFAGQLHVPRVRVRFTGLRPGEKLSETLFSEHESCRPTEHPRIVMSDGPGLADEFWVGLADLYVAAVANDAAAVRRLMSRMLPGYSAPSGPPDPAASSAPYADGF